VAHLRRAKIKMPPRAAEWGATACVRAKWEPVRWRRGSSAGESGINRIPSGAQRLIVLTINKLLSPLPSTQTTNREDTYFILNQSPEKPPRKNRSRRFHPTSFVAVRVHLWPVSVVAAIIGTRFHTRVRHVLNT
jgi:hypothetical protein